MDNNLTVFTSDQFGKVRVVTRDGEPWFVAADVCKALGLGQTSRALSRIDADGGGLLKIPHPQSKEKLIDVNGVNESGLYQLVFCSNKPEAKAFKHWIAFDVLPAIRKNGMYATEELLDDPELLYKVVTKLRDERAARVAAEKKLEAQQPKVQFFDKVAETKGLLTVAEFAKMLADNGMNIGRNRLFAWLRKEKFVDQYNVALQRAVNSGWLKVRETLVYRGDRWMPFAQTFVTGKGQQYLAERLQKQYPVTQTKPAVQTA